MSQATFILVQGCVTNHERPHPWYTCIVLHPHPPHVKQLHFQHLSMCLWRKVSKVTKTSSIHNPGRITSLKNDSNRQFQLSTDPCKQDMTSEKLIHVFLWLQKRQDRAWSTYTPWHKTKQRKVLTLQSTERQSGSCYSRQTIATEEEAYLKPILSGIMSSLLSITEESDPLSALWVTNKYSYTQ